MGNCHIQTWKRVPAIQISMGRISKSLKTGGSFSDFFAFGAGLPKKVSVIIVYKHNTLRKNGTF
jgi:hypothetical protein